MPSTFGSQRYSGRSCPLPAAGLESVNAVSLGLRPLPRIPASDRLTIDRKRPVGQRARPAISALKVREDATRAPYGAS
jgi:hypothetical protein